MAQTPDWIVDSIEATADARRYGAGAYYKLRVQGLNLNNGERFSWTVRDVADPRYDLTGARIAPDAAPFLGRDDARLCAECEAAVVDDDSPGVLHHVDVNGDVDHDRDADHVPMLDAA